MTRLVLPGAAAGSVKSRLRLVCPEPLLEAIGWNHICRVGRRARLNSDIGQSDRGVFISSKLNRGTSELRLLEGDHLQALRLRFTQIQGIPGRSGGENLRGGARRLSDLQGVGVFEATVRGCIQANARDRLIERQGEYGGGAGLGHAIQLQSSAVYRVCRLRARRAAIQCGDANGSCEARDAIDREGSGYGGRRRDFAIRTGNDIWRRGQPREIDVAVGVQPRGAIEPVAGERSPVECWDENQG